MTPTRVGSTTLCACLLFGSHAVAQTVVFDYRIIQKAQAEFVWINNSTAPRPPAWISSRRIDARWVPTYGSSALGTYCDFDGYCYPDTVRSFLQRVSVTAGVLLRL